MNRSCSAAGYVPRTVSSSRASKSGLSTHSARPRRRGAAGSRRSRGSARSRSSRRRAGGSPPACRRRTGRRGRRSRSSRPWRGPGAACGRRPREHRPPHQRRHRPREVVVQGGQRDVRARVGVVDRVHLAARDEVLARVELPPEERVHQPGDRHDLLADLGGEEPVRDLVPVVHRQLGPELHHHRLRPDRQRAREDVVAVDRLLQVHQPLPRDVVGRVQVVAVLDPGDAHPGATVVGLHEQRVARSARRPRRGRTAGCTARRCTPTSRGRRVLVRHEDGVGHLEPEAHHRAVGGVLLHRLERERAVEQVHVVHQRDLLQPLARVVVPVREPVDDQVVARLGRAG